MSLKTFRGGVFPADRKELCRGKELRFLVPKGELVYPLGQHMGKPAIAAVKKNDAVKAGQIIAKADGFNSANIISAASGKVKAIEQRMTSDGYVDQCIVIDNDGEFSLLEGIGEKCDYTRLSGEEIIEKIKAAGVVGLGGLGYPTHVKLSPEHPDEIDYIIANGSECEPYITCDEQLMIEKSDWIIGGLKIVMQLFPSSKAVVAIQNSKADAIKAVENAISDKNQISVMQLKTKYPQGGESNLVHAVTNRKLAPGDTPADLGCIVLNVTTLAAIYHAVALNEPLMEKGFTVSGDAVKDPGNFMVKIGTNLSEVLEAAGGFKTQPKKIIIGGPMRGMAVTSLDRPIAKKYNGLVCFIEDPVEKAAANMKHCIRCGKCLRSCPLGLMPQMMAVAVKRKDYAEFEKLYGMSCMECGCCTYACPSKRPLVHMFKQMKAEIMRKREEEA